jgi:thiol:disulfide interchange protein DsbA
MRSIMMRRILLPLLAVALSGGSTGAFSASSWSQGTNYFPIQPAQPTSVAAGKVEVTEVFSYACPACNRFYPIIDRLKAALPANAELTFVPAAFNTAEDWPMFQRAYLAAQTLGVDKRTHDAMFDAIWKTGELAVVDPASQRIKVPAPTIEDAAKFYARVAGVKAEMFVSTANSFGVDTKTRQADQFIRATQVDQTPTLVVNGKYRLTVSSAGSDDKLIELVLWLVAQESAKGAAATH